MSDVSSERIYTHSSIRIHLNANNICELHDCHPKGDNNYLPPGDHDMSYEMFGNK